MGKGVVKEKMDEQGFRKTGGETMLEPGYYNMDGVKALAQFPNKFFDIAVVDAPYFSGPEKRRYYGSEISRIGVKRRQYEPQVKEIPEKNGYCHSHVQRTDGKP